MELWNTHILCVSLLWKSERGEDDKMKFCPYKHGFTLQLQLQKHFQKIYNFHFCSMDCIDYITILQVESLRIINRISLRSYFQVTTQNMPWI